MTDQEHFFSQNFVFTGEDLDDLLCLFPSELRNHSRRVAICCSTMAEHADRLLTMREIPFLCSFELVAYLGGLCHDIGKFVISACNGLEEHDILHPTVGLQLLERHRRTLFGSETQADMVMEIVHTHHERFDGTGFPCQLQNMEIPLASGICSIADMLDHEVDAHKGIDMDILRKIQQLQGAAFSRTAVGCLVNAWQPLTERYDAWNTRNCG